VCGAELARRAGCKNEAMCNRLVELEAKGLVTSERFGRKRVFQVAKSNNWIYPSAKNAAKLRMTELPQIGHDVNELALFAGAGGGILGGHLLGWRTVCAVERDAYAAQVLAQRQNDGALRPFPIWSDVCSFDGRPWKGIVDVISGGFPCQDISAAGKGAGIQGKRSGLWSQFARIIGEVRPRFVLVENSPILTSRGLGRVLGDLAEMGFDARWGCVSAADAIWLDGTPALDHERERIWIVGRNDANALGSRREVSRNGAGDRQRADSSGERRGQRSNQSGNISPAADTNSINGRRGRRATGPQERAEIGDSGDTPANANGLRQLQPEGGEQDKRRRAGDTSECDRATEINPASVTAVLGAVQLLPGVLVQPTRHARLRVRLPGADGHGDRPLRNGGLGAGSECDSDSHDHRREEQRGAGSAGPEVPASECCGWWQFEPPVGRVAHGVAHRVDRLRAIGNGQVSPVVPLAWELLTAAEIEWSISPHFWKRSMEKLLAILFVVALSVGASICVMMFGWGMTPKNWWWIVGVGLFGQTVLTSLMQALVKTDGKWPMKLEEIKTLLAEIRLHRAEIPALVQAEKRLIVVRDRLQELRTKLIAEIEKHDVTSRGNYGWEVRFVDFLVAITEQ